MKNIWVHTAGSFTEAEDFERDYYLKMTKSERLDVVQRLREEYCKIKKGTVNARRKRLRRVLEIIEQK